uniref:CUB domain-containing protein n=1 Tax=Rhabditophanes sp. KR3021 TaxID=114890 RepID=A0AC35TLN0_9BILA
MEDSKDFLSNDAGASGEVNVEVYDEATTCLSGPLSEITCLSGRSSKYNNALSGLTSATASTCNGLSQYLQTGKDDLDSYLQTAAPRSYLDSMLQTATCDVDTAAPQSTFYNDLPTAISNHEYSRYSVSPRSVAISMNDVDIDARFKPDCFSVRSNESVDATALTNYTYSQYAASPAEIAIEVKHSDNIERENRLLASGDVYSQYSCSPAEICVEMTEFGNRKRFDSLCSTQISAYEDTSSIKSGFSTDTKSFYGSSFSLHSVDCSIISLNGPQGIEFNQKFEYFDAEYDPAYDDIETDVDGQRLQIFYY